MSIEHETLAELEPDGASATAGPSELDVTPVSLRHSVTVTRIRGPHSLEDIELDMLDLDALQAAGLCIEQTLRLEPGMTLPGTSYRLLRWLGEGGMGVVYECEHVELERRVALKVLRTGISPGSRRAAMFRDEARAVSRAGQRGDGQASNIVEIYDLGALPDGRQWFAMELVSGHSLSRELAQGPLNPARLIGLLRQICKGLAAAHEAGIVHRDIKPGNIMVTRERGRDDVVKLVDFGVATMMAGPEGAEEFYLEGTPAYMAPEQAAGTPFDHRLDVYAVGAVAFHLLTGVPPFEGPSVLHVLHKVQESPPPRASEFSPDREIPGALEAVLLRCMAKEPQERYADMIELEAALCEAQIEAGLTTSWDDLPLPDVDAERHEQLRRRMPQPATAGRPRARRAWWLLPLVAGVVLGVLGWATLRPEPDAAAATSDAVQVRAEAAYVAAARALYVYPPRDAPRTPTAYVEVLAIEALEAEHGQRARGTAAQLREEFAGTLVRLGDRYWAREGGRPFALDYYMSALLFSPTHARARERAAVSSGMLLALRHKASTLDFTDGELAASAPLLALAEPDDEQRLRKLEALGASRDARGPLAQHQLDTLLVHEKAIRGEAVAVREDAPPPSRPEPAGGDTGGPQPAGEASTGPEIAAAPEGTGAAIEPSVDEQEEPTRDREAARRLVGNGQAALRGGRRGEASRLFHRALEFDHRSAAAHHGLARVHYAHGDYSQAMRHARRAASLAPRNSSYRILLGDAYYKEYRYRDAKAAYERAQQLGHREAEGRLKKIRAKLGG